MLRSINESDLEILTSTHREGGHEVSIGVQPSCGANWVSFVIDGREYLYYDPASARGGEGELTGSFVMFPTPCRVPAGEYAFDGRRVVQRKRGAIHDIHGIVRDEPFQWERTGQGLRLWIDIEPGTPAYEGYPFAGRLTLTLDLLAAGVSYAFDFENRDSRPAPVGFGLHPWWRIVGDRAQTHLAVPCGKLMEMEDLVPNGRTTPVEGALDLRQPRCLADFGADNVYAGRTGPTSIEYRDVGVRLVIDPDPIFGHMVVFTGPGAPFACVEPLTCTPNAVNLQHLPPAETGLRIARPGEHVGGTVRFVVEEI